MERLLTRIEIANLGQKAWDEAVQVGCAVILTDIIAAKTGIVLTPGHIRTSETSFKAATQIIQNKLQESEM